MTIDDFNETVGTALPQRGARTLAGLVFDGLGRGPRAGDTVNVAATSTCASSRPPSTAPRITRAGPDAAAGADGRLTAILVNES